MGTRCDRSLQFYSQKSNFFWLHARLSSFHQSLHGCVHSSLLIHLLHCVLSFLQTLTNITPQLKIVPEMVTIRSCLRNWKLQSSAVFGKWVLSDWAATASGREVRSGGRCHVDTEPNTTKLETCCLMSCISTRSLLCCTTFIQWSWSRQFWSFFVCPDFRSRSLTLVSVCRCLCITASARWAVGSAWLSTASLWSFPLLGTTDGPTSQLWRVRGNIRIRLFSTYKRCVFGA